MNEYLLKYAITPRVIKADAMQTITLAESVDKIHESILAGNTVAVDNLNVEDRDIYGDLRLVKYAGS